MANEKLQIILDATWKGKGEIHQANKDISNLGDKADRTGAIFSKLAIVGVAAFGGLAAAAKLTFDSINRGAELELTASKFDNLAQSIGASADALMDNMKQASGGMVSNAQLMAGATELMSGKLARTQEEVIRLSTVSTQLGWDMGVLAQTINNQSVLRLDNLGVAAEDVIPKFEALKAAGMDVKSAFTEALVSAGEAKLEILGSKAETAAGKILILKAAWEDTRDAFDMGLLTGVSGQLDMIADNAVSMAEAAELAGQKWGAAVGYIIDRSLGAEIAQQRWADALAAGLVNEKEARIEMNHLEMGYVSTEESLTKLNERYQFWLSLQEDQIAVANSADTALLTYVNGIAAIEAAAQAAIGDVEGLTWALGNLAGMSTQGILQELQFVGGPNVSPGRMEAGSTARDGYSRYTSSIGKTRDATKAFADTLVMGVSNTISMRDALDDAKGSVGGFGGGLGTVKTELELVAEEMAALASATGDYFVQARKAKDFNPFEELFSAADKYGANAMQLANLGVAGGLFDEAQATEYLKRTAMMHRADTLARAVAAKQLTEEQAVGMLKGLQTSFDQGLDVADEFFAGINETQLTPEMLLNTDTAWADYVFIKSKIEANPPVVVVKVVNAVAAANADTIRGNIPQ